MTEVLIDGKKVTIRDQTRTEFLKIRSLLQRGFTYRKINDLFHAEGRKCSNYKIKKAQMWAPNGLLKQTETKTETIETSQLSKPPRPPTRARSETQIETRVKQRDTSEEKVWKDFEASKPKNYQVKEYIPEAVFTACAFYLQTRGKRAMNAKNPETSSEQSTIRELQQWARFQEWKIRVANQNKQDLMVELKQKIQKRKGGT